MSFLTVEETKTLYRTPEERSALRIKLEETFNRHSSECICGVCRFINPSVYDQCDECERHDLKENMVACFTMPVDGEVDHYLCAQCLLEAMS